MKNQEKKSGYVILMSILILGAIGVSIGLFILSSSITTSKITVAREQGIIAQHLAEACMEKALDNLRQNVNYAGNEILTIAPGKNCSILPLLGTGSSNRTVRTIATVNNSTKKIEVFVTTVTPQMVLNYWKEKTDF